MADTNAQQYPFDVTRPQQTMPLCHVHARLEDQERLLLPFGNRCVACSLNERQELLAALESVIPEGETPDAVEFLHRLLRRFNAKLLENAEKKVDELSVCLRDLMACYERRIRSLCTPEQLKLQPWRVAEYVAAEEALEAARTADIKE